jgi:hypothetical protein
MEFVNQTLGQLLLFGGIVSSVLVTWHLLLLRRAWAHAAILGTWMLTAGIWMVVLADEPSPEPLVHLRNLLLIGGTAGLWWSCLRYLGRKPSPWPIIGGLGVLMLTLAWAHQVRPGPIARAAVFSVHVAIWNAATAWAFFRAEGLERSLSRYFGFALFGGNAVVNLGRAGYMAAHLSAPDLLLPTALTYVYALVFLMLQALLLWGMGESAASPSE